MLALGTSRILARRFLLGLEVVAAVPVAKGPLELSHAKRCLVVISPSSWGARVLALDTLGVSA